MHTKTKYNPEVHHRRSIRKRGYDYSCDGFYFVTVCCAYKMLLFGEISDNVMILNDAGRMIVKWYYKTAEKFPNIRCLENVVMPNHFHCIWQIQNDLVPAPVGADPRVCPDKRVPPVCSYKTLPDDNHKISDAYTFDSEEHLFNKGRHVGLPLHRVIQWFKTMTTNEYIRGVGQYNWTPFNEKLWQRNYYEHIIPDADAYDNIAKYIADNPANWQDDILYIHPNLLYADPDDIAR